MNTRYARAVKCGELPYHSNVPQLLFAAAADAAAAAAAAAGSARCGSAQQVFVHSPMTTITVARWKVC